MSARKGSLAADLSVVLARHGLPAIPDWITQGLVRVGTAVDIATLGRPDEVFLIAHAGRYATASLIDPDIHQAAFAPWPDLSMLTTRELAQRLGTARSTVTRRAKSGRLLAYLNERGYLFPPSGSSSPRPRSPASASLSRMSRPGGVLTGSPDS